MKISKSRGCDEIISPCAKLKTWSELFDLLESPNGFKCIRDLNLYAQVIRDLDLLVPATLRVDGLGMIEYAPPLVKYSPKLGDVINDSLITIKVLDVQFVTKAPNRSLESKWDVVPNDRLSCLPLGNKLTKGLESVRSVSQCWERLHWLLDGIGHTGYHNTNDYYAYRNKQDDVEMLAANLDALKCEGFFKKGQFLYCWPLLPGANIRKTKPKSLLSCLESAHWLVAKHPGELVGDKE